MTEQIKPEKCRRCKLPIHPKDNYCRLTEWKQGVLLSEGWYHVHCFREGLHGSKDEKDIKIKADKFIDKATEMLSKLGVNC